MMFLALFDGLSVIDVYPAAAHRGRSPILFARLKLCSIMSRTTSTCSDKTLIALVVFSPFSSGPSILIFIRCKFDSPSCRRMMVIAGIQLAARPARQPSCDRRGDKEDGPARLGHRVS